MPVAPHTANHLPAIRSDPLIPSSLSVYSAHGQHCKLPPISRFIAIAAPFMTRLGSKKYSSRFRRQGAIRRCRIRSNLTACPSSPLSPEHVYLQGGHVMNRTRRGRWNVVRVHGNTDRRCLPFRGKEKGDISSPAFYTSREFV